MHGARCSKIDSIGRCQFCNQLSKESLLNQIVKRLRIPLINIPLLSRDYDVCSTHQPNECTLCAHFVDLWAQQLLFSCSTCYKPAASTPTAVKPVKKVLAWGRNRFVACIVLIFRSLVFLCWKLFQKIMTTIGCSCCSLQLQSRQLSSRLSVYWHGSENFEGGAAGVVLIFLNFALCWKLLLKKCTLCIGCSSQAGSSSSD